MNAFAEYAGAAIPQSVQRKQAKQEARQASPLEAKMAEKERLSKAYRFWQHQVRAEALEQEPRLHDFMKYLRSVKGEHADELLDQVRHSWLPVAAQNVRIVALRLIDRHANRLNRMAGTESLNDPLPPETSVYFEARDMLHKGGMA